MERKGGREGGPRLGGFGDRHAPTEPPVPRLLAAERKREEGGGGQRDPTAKGLRKGGRRDPPSGKVSEAHRPGQLLPAVLGAKLAPLSLAAAGCPGDQEGGGGEDHLDRALRLLPRETGQGGLSAALLAVVSQRIIPRQRLSS